MVEGGTMIMQRHEDVDTTRSITRNASMTKPILKETRIIELNAGTRCIRSTSRHALEEASRNVVLA